MKSAFSVNGHPIHPMLVALPIGLFVWTFAADIIYLATDDKLWYDIAFWSGIAAIVTGLIAALPGLGDYLTIARHSDARSIALTHGILNVVVVALFTVAMLLMLDEGALDGAERTWMVILHAAGVGLLAVSGWLGGELVFRKHLAIIPDDATVAEAEHQRHERVPARQAAGRRAGQRT